jgi:hypothetical protein
MAKDKEPLTPLQEKYLHKQVVFEGSGDGQATVSGFCERITAAGAVTILHPDGTRHVVPANTKLRLAEK